MLRRVPLILLIPLDRGYPDPVDTPAPDLGHRESMPFNAITHLGYAPQPVDHQSANRVVGTGGQLDAGPLNELVETEQPVDQVGAVSGLGLPTHDRGATRWEPGEEIAPGWRRGAFIRVPTITFTAAFEERALPGSRMNKSEELT